MHYFKSVNGGVTWGPQMPATDSVGGDKQWFALDRTGGIGHGNIYMAWNTAAGCCGSNIFSRSIDGSVSFMTPIGVPNNVIFGTNGVAADGTFYLAGVGGSFSDFYCVRSTNAQNPVMTPVFDLATNVSLGGSMGFGGGPNPDGLHGQANLGINDADGEVYLLCSVDPPGNDPLDVMFASSADGGATWSAPVRVNDDAAGPNAWQWFGTMSVSPDGRIDVVWNDTRASGQVNVGELYYSSSTDGGVTWSANVALSPAWDSFVGWPNQNKIGDYYDMVSDRVGAHLAYAATFNGEQDVYYLRIGDYDCNDNGIPDTADIADGSSDCNANGIPDACEIAAGTEIDENRNGIPDACEVCPWDCDGSNDGIVGVDDFLAVLAQWGMTGTSCAVEGAVGVEEFLDVLAHWGACPGN